jgi:hypothetical protein
MAFKGWVFVLWCVRWVGGSMPLAACLSKAVTEFFWG